MRRPTVATAPALVWKIRRSRGFMRRQIVSGVHIAAGILDGGGRSRATSCVQRIAGDGLEGRSQGDDQDQYSGD